MSHGSEVAEGKVGGGAPAIHEALTRAFERPEEGGPFDETDINLRGYITQIPREKLAVYDPAWTDEEVMQWDGNFREDGDLMLVCCERDVDVREFREVLEAWIGLVAGR